MKKFIDETYFEAKAGNGGNGIVSFERYKYQPIGKPSGGDGGFGGNVIIQVDENYSDLSHLKKINLIKAGNGQNGGRSNKKGKNGADAVIKVPQGIVIKDYYSKKVIKEMIEHKDQFIICHGGKGGKGNFHFKSSTNRSPRKFEYGQPGENKKILIELYLLADIGLIGFPNAGKSTLLNAITQARPEIADFPFTTLTPNLGILYDEFHNSLRIADMPGIIKDAHSGKGLGLRFLKHISRTKMLCILIDISEKDFEDKLNIILNELKLYKSDLLQKKIIFVGNKIDLINDKEFENKLSKKFILISALEKINLDELVKVFFGEVNKII